MVETQHPANIAILHRILGISLTLLAACFLALTYLGVVPPLLGASTPPLFAYAFAGVAAVVAAVALVVFKPRVPRRGPGQSIDEYWSTPQVSGACLMVWVLLEGAGVIAGVGYVLTGQNLLSVAMGVVVVAFWLCGPRQLANE